MKTRLRRILNRMQTIYILINIAIILNISNCVLHGGQMPFWNFLNSTETNLQWASASIFNFFGDWIPFGSYLMSIGDTILLITVGIQISIIYEAIRILIENKASIFQEIKLSEILSQNTIENK